MRIGYACQTLGLSQHHYRNVTLKNATIETCSSVIEHNLQALQQAILYNIHNEIQLFRITSDMIPFGSGPIHLVDWQTKYQHELKAIGAMIRQSNMRVSMHPGQYTVLNAKVPDIAERAVADLDYHVSFLDCLELDKTNKVVIHIGGKYDNKAESAQRFITRYFDLPTRIKQRIVIENDERSFHIQDVLSISETCGIPVVFDHLHHTIHPPKINKPDFDWLEDCCNTWDKSDGVPKMHYSQQAGNKRVGSHSETIFIRPFLAYLKTIKGLEVDMMLEVKDKDLSALKCMQCLQKGLPIHTLETVWAKYKYTVLEHSALLYQQIRQLLRDKSQNHAIPFYTLVDEALSADVTASSFRNAAQHVWGYFKNEVSEKEKTTFMDLMNRQPSTVSTQKTIKRYLAKLALKYQQKYLLDSYYFIID